MRWIWGPGTGIIPILLSDRTDGSISRELEIQHECAEMADRSMGYNGLGQRVRIVRKLISGKLPGFLGQLLLMW